MPRPVSCVSLGCERTQSRFYACYALVDYMVCSCKVKVRVERGLGLGLNSG